MTQSPANPGVPVPGTSPLAGKRVVIVENDAFIAEMARITLEDAGAERIDISNTMHGAMTFLDQGQPDIILLDVRLDDRTDGWAIAELVTGISSRTPTIIFSTGSPETIPGDIANVGIVLPKPYAPEELLSVILHGKPTSQPNMTPTENSAPVGWFRRLWHRH